MSHCQPTPIPPRWRAGAVLLLLAGSVPYAGTLSAPMVFDSRDHIVDRDAFRNFVPVSEFRAVPRWVADNTFALNRLAGGQSPSGYHAVNILIHVAAGLALWGVLRRTLRSSRLTPPLGEWAEPVALAAALLWVVHPLQTESVTYVIQRYESLMGLCYLLTLYCFIRATAVGRTGIRDPAAPQTWAWLSASVVCCVLGLRSKEVMVTAPLLVLWYDRAFVSRSWRELLQRHWGYYAALGAVWVWLMCPLVGDVADGLQARFVPPSASAPSKPRSTIIDVAGVTPIDYALTQPGVILHYVRLAFWPRGLCLDHDWPLAEGVDATPLVMLGTLLALVVLHVRRRPGWAYLGGWFLVILAPTSSIVPIQDLACEHRMYLPLAALTTAFAGGLYAAGQLIPALRRRAVWTTLIAGISLALGIATFLRNRDYRSESAIWRSVVSQRPGNVRARLGLGMALAGEGNSAAAAEEFLTAAELQPLEVRAHYLAGRELRVSGRLDEAVGRLQMALRLRPDSVSARYELALALERQGKLRQAVEELQQVVRSRPDLHEAAVHLAAILVTSRDTDLRDAPAALRLAERACASTAHPAAAWLDTLAMAQAATGDFGSAMATARRAAELDGSDVDASELGRRFERYQSLTAPPATK